METNISNDRLWAREKAPLMGEAFNWMGRQVRLGQAVKFPVKCPHPGVSFESQTWLLVNHLELFNGLVPFLTKILGLWCFYWPVFSVVWRSVNLPLTLSQTSRCSSSCSTLFNCRLMSICCFLCVRTVPQTIDFTRHFSLFLLSFNSIQRRSEMSSGRPRGWDWIGESPDEDRMHLKS